MDYSFPNYLLSKRTVDDRALNPHVYDRLRSALPASRPLRIAEVGAGIGTMLVRLLEWGLLDQADYAAVDESSENIAFARQWLPGQARDLGLGVDWSSGVFRLHGQDREVQASLVASDVFDFIKAQSLRADLLIAHAFLDLLPLPASLPSLFSLLSPSGLAWLTLNFDGATIFEPAIDPAFDMRVEALYHRSMDERLTNGLPSGDSRTGRHLFTYLHRSGAEILDAGASDWVVFPRGGRYPADEAYFLHFILHFFESSLGDHPDLDQRRFADWLAARHAQVERGELVYIAHQMDFLVKIR